MVQKRHRRLAASSTRRPRNENVPVEIRMHRCAQHGERTLGARGARRFPASELGVQKYLIEMEERMGRAHQVGKAGDKRRRFAPTWKTMYQSIGRAADHSREVCRWHAQGRGLIAIKNLTIWQTTTSV